MLKKDKSQNTYQHYMSHGVHQITKLLKQLEQL